MKLDFNIPVKGISGKPLKNDGKEQILSKVLASHLANGSSKIAPLKLWGWCADLWNEKVIDIDTSDIPILKESITDNETMTVLAKGQALEVIVKTDLDSEKPHK